MQSNEQATPDLGNFVIVLLAGTLAALRDRLMEEGFAKAADHVARLVDLCDGYVDSIESKAEGSASTPDPHSRARRVFDRHIRPAIYEFAASKGEEGAEYFAASILYNLRGELGWSVAYYSSSDALQYWCTATDRDEDELTEDDKAQFEDFWSSWRHSKPWNDAMWLDEYTGDSIVELIRWHIRETEEKRQ